MPTDATAIRLCLDCRERPALGFSLRCAECAAAHARSAQREAQRRHPAAGPARGKHLAAWRDVDSRRRRFGFVVWLTGAEVSVGRRLYRVRWWAR